MSTASPIKGFKAQPGTDEFLAEYRKVKRSIATWDFIIKCVSSALIMLGGMILIWLVLIFFATYDAVKGF